MENPQNKKPNKYVVLATYLVAVVCLLSGLFLPFFGGKGADGMLALQLPDVINKIANKNLTTAGKTFALSYQVAIPGTTKTVDVMAYVALFYTAVTLFSLIALIPVGISTKKGTKTASVFAYIVEIAAVAVTSVYVMIALQYQVSADLMLPAELLPAVSNFSYSMLVALAGPLLMLILLSILNKKGTGAAKTFLFLLSAVGVLTLYDFSLIFPKLAEFKLAPALFGAAGTGTGINSLNLLFEGGFKDYFSLQPDVKSKTVLILCTAAALIVVINYFIDIIGLSTNAKKTGIVFNVTRYGLGLIAVLALFITVTICKYKIGIMLIVLPSAIVIQLLISIVRLIINLKKAKKETAEPTADKVEQVEFEEPVRPYRQRPVYVEPVPRVKEEVYEQPVSEPVYAEPERRQPVPEPVYAEPERHQPVPEPVYAEPERHQPVQDKYGFNESLKEEPVQMDIADIAEPESVPVPVRSAPPVQTAAQPRTNNAGQETRIYTINTIYGGPVDEFMRKLTNDEKIEFAMTFIEKSKGNIGNIPEYVIGGNNRLFFSSVFIYLGRIRGLISDGLLNKMYKELNML